MASIYQQEFAKEPWLEVSKCANSACGAGMGSCPVGSACNQCGQQLTPAYDVDELITGWAELLDEGRSWLEAVVVRGCLHPGDTGA